MHRSIFILVHGLKVASVIAIGGKVAGASPAYNVEEMSYALAKAETKFLMTTPNSLKVAVAAAKVAGIPREHIFLLEGKAEGFTTFKDLQEIGKGYGEQGQIQPHTIPAGKTNKDICGFLNFSSGTTGLPKAVRDIIGIFQGEVTLLTLYCRLCFRTTM